MKKYGFPFRNFHGVITDIGSKGFRSSPGPNAGLLDAEFEAFQAGNPLQTGFPESLAIFNPPPQNAVKNGFQQPVWASDFRDSQVIEKSVTPSSAPRLHHHAPFRQETPHAWHQDYLWQQNQSARALPPQSRSPYQPAFQQKPLPPHFTMPFHRSSELQTTSSHGEHREADQGATLDDAAFEEAFREIQISAHVTSKDEATALEAETSKPFAEIENPAEDAAGLNAQPRAYHIGSETIQDGNREEAKERNEAHEADELARTAGRLLENVRDDKSKKFRESNFLSLMRQLRDREVKIDGDKIVDNVSQSA
ncbi:MAG: hypothetical protein Q9163_003279 [Psora crenata]